MITKMFNMKITFKYFASLIQKRRAAPIILRYLNWVYIGNMKTVRSITVP